MAEHNYQVRQLVEELQPPESGKKRVVLADDENTKVVLFASAAGDGLAEHVAPMPAIIQIIKDVASLTIGGDAVSEQSGTWIHMPANAPHSVKARKPMDMMLTPLK